MADFYELLGLSRDASDDEIKKGYRKLALQYHPDRNQGSTESEEKFKEITEAYEVLRDAEKRALYDRYGEQGIQGRPGPGGFGGFDFSDAIEVFMRDFGGFGGLEDIFQGGGARRGGGSGRGQRGQNVRIRIPVTLKEVVSGVNKRVRVQLLESCETCDGSGAAKGTHPQTCTQCGGAGEERVIQRSVFGQFVSVAPCRQCGGQGQVISEPCSTCHGDGRARKEKEVEVEIPPGVSSENFITLRGQGHVGSRGGGRGDIVVLLDVEEDARLTREGANLHLELPVTFTQAALGAQVRVPTVDGEADLKVPAGVQSGSVLRMRALGLPELNGRGRGDLLIHIHVWTPQNLSAEQRALIEDLQAQETPAPETLGDDEERGFWSRVREAFSS